VIRTARLLHTVLVPWTAALWAFAFACDVMSVIDRENWIWPSVAFYALGAGVLTALAAGAFELVDYVCLDRAARKAGLRKLVVSAVVFAVFGIDLAMRLSDFFGLIAPVVVSAVGIAFLALAGRLGGGPDVRARSPRSARSSRIVASS